jgi:mono/diheme cytochrome c family protein
MKPAIGLVLIFSLLAGSAGGLYIYLGLYNVAATEQHSPLVFEFMQYTMRRSVMAHARDVEIPDLNDPRRIQNGALLYVRHCLQCHGGPGIAPDPVGMGVMPAPANLVETGREWSAEEIYWVIKHGLKMTAMPAWKYRLSEQDIVDLTAFVTLLPTISPTDYKNKYHVQVAENVPATSSEDPEDIENMHVGDAQAGRRAIQQYLCITCHQIPGVVGTTGAVGPPLGGIANRKYIGGVLYNTPTNMRAWLRNPQQFSPLTAMPNLNIKENDIRDITAYLYTLE